VVNWQHVAEIPFENEWVTKTRGVDHGTVTHLENIGVLGENLLAAHSVWVSPNEVFTDPSPSSEKSLLTFRLLIYGY